MTPWNNFSGQLVQRLGEHSYLIDAATGETILPSDLRRTIISFGASLLSTGLNPSNRILIGCTLSPSSSIAYLGAMYAGLVPVPIEEATLVASTTSLLRATDARALWIERDLQFDGIPETGVLTFHGLPAEQRADDASPAPCEENDLAALFATSGSTGTPRFVMVSHRNL